MSRAIAALIAEPQNNFRLFKNGTLIYGEGGGIGGGKVHSPPSTTKTPQMQLNENVFHNNLIQMY